MKDEMDKVIEAMDKEAALSKWANRGKSISQLLVEFKERGLKFHEHSLDFSSWLPRLAKILDPIPLGMMVSVLADTNGGKTAFIQNLVLKMKVPLKTIFFQLELPDDASTARFIAIQQSIPARDVRAAIMANEIKDVNAFNHLTTYSSASFSIADIQEIVEIEKPKLVIIDYVGLVRDRKSKGSRYEKLSDISEELKLMATSKEVIVLIGVQIHRKENNNTGEIFLHDARDSSSLEQSCQYSLGIWREGEDNEKMLIKVLKNQGLKDMIFPACFDNETLQITEDYGIPRKKI